MRAASAELDSASIRTPTIIEFFSIGTLLAFLTEAHMPKAISDTLIVVNKRIACFAPERLYRCAMNLTG
jgi:hypothetical protein